MIDKKTLENLAALARIELDPKNEIKLIHDLEKILEHFDELKSVDTSQVNPMTGGMALVNEFREDNSGDMDLSGDLAKEQFPETKDGFLKIPPVFSAKGGFPPKADAPREHASGEE